MYLVAQIEGDSHEQHEYLRYWKQYRAGGCRMSRLGASQTMERFARKLQSFAPCGRSQSPNRCEIASNRVCNMAVP